MNKPVEPKSYLIEIKNEDIRNYINTIKNPPFPKHLYGGEKREILELIEDCESLCKKIPNAISISVDLDDNGCFSTKDLIISILGRHASQKLTCFNPIVIHDTISKKILQSENDFDVLVTIKELDTLIDKIFETASIKNRNKYQDEALLKLSEEALNVREILKRKVNLSNLAESGNGSIILTK